MNFEFLRGKRPTRRDDLNHEVGSPTNKELDKLIDPHLMSYRFALDRQIQNEGSPNEGRKIALKRAEQKLKEEEAIRASYGSR